MEAIPIATLSAKAETLTMVMMMMMTIMMTMMDVMATKCLHFAAAADDDDVPVYQLNRSECFHTAY